MSSDRSADRELTWTHWLVSLQWLDAGFRNTNGAHSLLDKSVFNVEVTRACTGGVKVVETQATGTDVVTERIRAYIHAAVEPEVIDDGTDLFATGLLGSLFALELVTFVEDEFEIELDIEDLEIKHFACVTNLQAFVSRKLAGNGGTGSEGLSQ